MKRLESIKLKPVKETNAKIEALGFKAWQMQWQPKNLCV